MIKDLDIRILQELVSYYQDAVNELLLLDNELGIDLTDSEYRAKVQKQIKGLKVRTSYIEKDSPDKYSPIER